PLFPYTTPFRSRAARDAKLDELHERLTGAVEQLVSGEDWARALAFAAQCRSRSFNNTLLIWFQHAANYEAGRVPSPVPSYVAGYRQWQTLGRQVAKGQPGYMIYAPATGRRWSGPSPPTSGMRRKPPGIRSRIPDPEAARRGSACRALRRPRRAGRCGRVRAVPGRAPGVDPRRERAHRLHGEDGVGAGEHRARRACENPRTRAWACADARPGPGRGAAAPRNRRGRGRVGCVDGVWCRNG